MHNVQGAGAEIPPRMARKRGKKMPQKCFKPGADSSAHMVSVLHPKGGKPTSEVSIVQYLAQSENGSSLNATKPPQRRFFGANNDIGG